jgi:hypothetical protein
VAEDKAAADRAAAVVEGPEGPEGPEVAEAAGGWHPEAARG